VTQLGCPTCGTGLSGQFRSCEFCGLDEAERDVLRVFLSSRGNMKELERHLGVSYPTARARFDDLLRALGLTAGSGPGPVGVPATAPGARAGDVPAPAGGGAPGTTPPDDGVDPRLDTLQAVARGDLGVDDARRRLAQESP
jgi:hypothetical protein